MTEKTMFQKFAHLVGGAAPPAAAVQPAAAKAEGDDDDDDRKKKDDETDAQHAARIKKMDEDKEKEEAKAAKKKAKAESDDDDKGDDEDEKDDDKKAIRARERARCEAIFADPAAGRNPTLAAALAFGTSLNRSAAIAMLQAGGTAVQPAATPKVSRLDRAMAAVPVPDVGAGGGRAAVDDNSPAAIAARIVAARQPKKDAA